MPLQQFTGKQGVLLINDPNSCPGIATTFGSLNKHFKMLPTVASRCPTGTGRGKEGVWIPSSLPTVLGVAMEGVSPMELLLAGVLKQIVVDVCNDNSIGDFPLPETSKC